MIGLLRYGRLLHKAIYNHNTLTTLRTSVKESLEMHFKVAVGTFV